MGESWYYTDSAGAQVGPASAAEVRDALGSARASGASLAWRDGMAGWLPISQLGAELGLDPAPIYADDRRPIGWSEPNPYRAPSASVEMGVDSTDIVPAGFVRRFAAMFLDSLILTIPVIALAVFAGLAVSGGDMLQATQSGTFQLIYYLGLFVVKLFYFAGMESSASQATLGKMAVGIKVTDDRGQRLTFGHALGRWFAAALSYITLYVGFLMAAFTDRKRALHDMVAGTLVVDKWAYTSNPERQKRGLSGCLIVFVVVMVLAPFLIAMFAAVAISQYQDYVKRSQQSQGSLIESATQYQVAGAAPPCWRDGSVRYAWT